MELERFQLKGVRIFCNDVVRVMDKYEVLKTNHEMCTLMSCKNQDATDETQCKSMQEEQRALHGCTTKEQYW